MIRNAQMAALRNGIVRELVAEVQAAWPAGTPPDEATLLQALREAALYGFATRSQLRRFLMLGARLGLPFSDDPAQDWAHAICRDADLRPDQKLSLLEEGLNHQAA